MLRLLFITIFSNTQTKFLGRIAQERYYYISKASKKINGSAFITFFFSSNSESKTVSLTYFFLAKKLQMNLNRNTNWNYVSKKNVAQGIGLRPLS